MTMNLNANITIDGADLSEIVKATLATEGVPTAEQMHMAVADSVEERIADSIRNGTVPSEDRVSDLITDAISEAIDGRDFKTAVCNAVEDYDGLMTEDAVQDLIDQEIDRRSLPDENDVRSIARDEIEDYDFDDDIQTYLDRNDIGSGSLDTSEAADWATDQLRSLPDTVSRRCSLGRAFQDAIVKVLTNVVDGTLEVPGLNPSLLTGKAEPTVVAGVSTTTADAEGETVQERHERLRNTHTVDGPFGFQFVGDPTVYVYPTHEAAADAYGADQRDGDEFHAVVTIGFDQPTVAEPEYQYVIVRTDADAPIDPNGIVNLPVGRKLIVGPFLTMTALTEWVEAHPGEARGTIARIDRPRA